MLSNEVLFNSHVSFEFHAFVFSSRPSSVWQSTDDPAIPTLLTVNSQSYCPITHRNYNKILIRSDFNLHIDNCSDPLLRELLNLLHCLDINQHVRQPTHSRGRTLDLVITYGLSIGAPSVVDLAVSDYFCVFFTITSFNQQEAPVRTVRKLLKWLQILSRFYRAPCDFTVDSFNHKIKSALDYTLMEKCRN